MWVFFRFLSKASVSKLVKKEILSRKLNAIKLQTRIKIEDIYIYIYIYIYIDMYTFISWIHERIIWEAVDV